MVHILHSELLKLSLNTSNFDTTRDYVSLSNIHKPVDELLSDYFNGYSASEDVKLKCRMGYYMEAGLKKRLLKIEGVRNAEEIVVPQSGNLIKGHPDFSYFNLPGDCKSLLMDDYLPDERKIPRKIYWQMNAYMLYGSSNMSVIVCESRESGKIKTIPIRRNDSICDQINAKCIEIIDRLNYYSQELKTNSNAQSNFHLRND